MSGLNLSSENLGVLKDLLMSEKTHSVILNFIECLENTYEISEVVEQTKKIIVIKSKPELEVEIERPSLIGRKKRKKPKQRPLKQKKYEPVTSFGYKFGEPNAHFSIVDSAKQNKAKLTQTATNAEKIFIGFLKSENIKYEFQKIYYYDSSYYIVDFYIPSAKLVVEIDGRYHDNSLQQRDDELRTRRLISCGVDRVARFNNDDLSNKPKILEKLYSCIEEFENK